MTQLRKMTFEELERRNYSQATARAYIDAIRRFALHFHRPPDQLGPIEIREYQLHLYQRKLHPQTIRVQTAALRFFYRKVSGRSASPSCIRPRRELKEKPSAHAWPRETVVEPLRLCQSRGRTADQSI